MVIDIGRQESDSPPGSINAIPAGMEPDDQEARYRQMERQWHRQMAIDHPVAQSEFPRPSRP